MIAYHNVALITKKLRAVNNPLSGKMPEPRTRS